MVDKSRCQTGRTDETDDDGNHGASLDDDAGSHARDLHGACTAARSAGATAVSIFMQARSTHIVGRRP